MLPDAGLLEVVMEMEKRKYLGRKEEWILNPGQGFLLAQAPAGVRTTDLCPGNRGFSSRICHMQPVGTRLAAMASPVPSSWRLVSAVLCSPARCFCFQTQPVSPFKGLLESTWLFTVLP